MIRVGAAAVLLGLGAPPLAAAQIVAVQADPTTQEWTFGELGLFGLRGVRTRAVPFSVTARTNERVSVRVASAWAVGRLEGDDGAVVETSTGPRDVDLAASFFPTPRLRLGLTGRIPVGEPEWTVADATLAGLTASGLLPVVERTWTPGSAMGGEVEVAAPMGAGAVRLLAAYRRAGGTIALAGTGLGYRPGDQIDLGATVDVRISDEGFLALSALVRHFGEDSAEGTGLHQAGRRIDASATLAAPIALRGSMLAYAGVTQRRGGEGRVGAGPGQDALQMYRNLLPGLTGTPDLLAVSTGMRVRWALDRVAVEPEAVGRLVRGDDSCGGNGADPATCLADQGWLARGGLTLEFRAAGPPGRPILLLRPHGAWSFGRTVPAEGREARITGWEAGVSIRIAGGVR